MRTITISDWVNWGEANAAAWNAAYQHGKQMMTARQRELEAAGLVWAQVRVDPEYAAIRDRAWAIHAWLNTPLGIVADAAAAVPMQEAA